MKKDSKPLSDHDAKARALADKQFKDFLEKEAKNPNRIPFKSDIAAFRESFNGGKPVSGDLWAKMNDPFAQYFTPSDLNTRIQPFELNDTAFRWLNADPVWHDGKEGHYTANDAIRVLREMAQIANKMIQRIEEGERIMKEAMEKK